MTSWRLWRSLVAMDIDDPIFRRVSEIRKLAAPPKAKTRMPRLLIVAAIPALAAALAHKPELLVLILVIPMLLITLMVATPVLLPLIAIAASIRLMVDVIGGIYREKHQHTYELICASTRGALQASWSFAAGVLYRSDWFPPLRWGTLLSCRLGLALLGVLSALTLLAALLTPAGGRHGAIAAAGAGGAAAGSLLQQHDADPGAELARRPVREQLRLVAQ